MTITRSGQFAPKSTIKFLFTGWAMGLRTIPGHQQGARCKATRSDERCV
ncbi:MAG: hypothetical protein HN978_02185 [Desulfobacula sp.]|nr:hypothetical protein [Desulfobacula sp.]